MSVISAQIFLFSGKFKELEAPFPTDPRQEMVTVDERVNAQCLNWDSHMLIPDGQVCAKFNSYTISEKKGCSRRGRTEASRHPSSV